MSTTRAHAKINLRLRIVGRRDDGYHLLDSWIVPLAESWDEVAIAARAGGPGVGLAVACPGFPALETEDNLAARAARAYAEAARRGGRPLAPGALDLAIRIDKRIPLEAGLGGGSSDAAAVLRLMQKAHGALDDAALRAVAADLGADVPFFLREAPARATGAGERLDPAPWPEERHVALARPATGLRTADVYRRFDALRAGGEGPGGPAGAPAPAPYGNDLQDAALDLCPAIAPLLAALAAAGARAALVTGSGSACFGLFETAEAAAAGAAAARAAGAAWSHVSRIGPLENGEAQV